MALRIIVSIAALPLLFIILYVFPPWAVPVALTIISAISAYELLIATHFLKNKLLLCVSVIFSTFVIPWVYMGSPAVSASAAVVAFTCVLFLIALIDNKNVTFEQICGAFFTGIFIPLAFSCIIRILRMENGDLLVLLPFI